MNKRWQIVENLLGFTQKCCTEVLRMWKIMLIMNINPSGR